MKIDFLIKLSSYRPVIFTKTPKRGIENSSLLLREMLDFKLTAKYLHLRRSEFPSIFRNRLTANVSADLLRAILKWNEKVFLLRNMPSLAVFVIALHTTSISAGTLLLHTHFTLTLSPGPFNLTFTNAISNVFKQFIIISKIRRFGPWMGKRKPLIKRLFL